MTCEKLYSSANGGDELNYYRELLVYILLVTWSCCLLVRIIWLMSVSGFVPLITKASVHTSVLF